MFWVAALKAWNFISYKILFVCKTKSAIHLYIYTAICPFHITISNYAILHISYSQRVNIVAFSWSFHRFKFFRKNYGTIYVQTLVSCFILNPRIPKEAGIAEQERNLWLEHSWQQIMLTIFPINVTFIVSNWWILHPTFKMSSFYQLITCLRLWTHWKLHLNFFSLIFFLICSLVSYNMDTNIWIIV